jgi:NitT/TauT family transport system substrate-binding protein
MKNLGVLLLIAAAQWAAIGTFPSPSTNYTLMQEAIISGGAPLAGTKIVQAPIGAQIALLEKGEADIAMVLEPAASKADADGYRVVFSSPQFNGPFAFTGMTVSSDFVKSQPRTVQAMVNALQKALVYCHSDPSGATAVAKKLFPSLPPEVVEKAVQRMLTENTIPKDVRVSEAAWDAAVRTRVSVGDLKKPQEYRLSVDSSFADQAGKK